MASINIQLPVMDAESSIEIEVRVNGEKSTYHYRVEVFKWEGCEQSMTYAECLKDMLKKYDQEWRVIQIGGPTNHSIPVMFKQKTN
jgi:hypothetical protein